MNEMDSIIDKILVKRSQVSHIYSASLDRQFFLKMLGVTAARKDNGHDDVPVQKIISVYMDILDKYIKNRGEGEC